MSHHIINKIKQRKFIQFINEISFYFNLYFIYGQFDQASNIEQIDEPIYLVGVSKVTKFTKGGNDCGIKETVTKYFQEGHPDEIPHKNNDQDGFQHMFFQGLEVDKVVGLPEALTIIPPKRYEKLTIGPGKMPQIYIQAWDELVKWSDERLGGQRAREIDFEIYDERAKDENDTTFDMFIQLK